jgi:hypothetical protein
MALAERKVAGNRYRGKSAGAQGGGRCRRNSHRGDADATPAAIKRHLPNHRHR